MDLRPHRGTCAASPFRDTAECGAARPVVVGLRRAVPVGREGRRPARRRDCAGAASRIIVKGLNRLFDSPEIQAVVGIFRLHGRRDRGAAAAGALGRRRAAPAGGDWADGAARAGRGPRLRPRRAVGRLQHPAPLPGVPRGARHARGHASRRPGARASSSSTSSASSARRSRTSRQIHFTTEPSAEVRGVRQVARAPGARLLRRRRTPTSATPRRTPSPSRPSTRPRGMQWPAVFLPCLRKNRFPVEAAWAALGLLPRHPGRRDRRPRPLPRHGRGRDAPVLRRRHPRAEVPVRVVLARPRNQLYSERARTSSTTAPRSSGSRPGTPACRRRRRGSSRTPGTRRRKSRSRSRS